MTFNITGFYFIIDVLYWLTLLSTTLISLIVTITNLAIKRNLVVGNRGSGFVYERRTTPN